MRVLGVDPLQLFLKGSGHITHYVMIIIRYRPLRCSYKPLLLLAYIKALPWVAIVYSKSRWMDGYVHMIKEVLGRQHRKKSAARYSFAECQYSRLLKVTRLVNTLKSSHLSSKCLRWVWRDYDLNYVFRFVKGAAQQVGLHGCSNNQKIKITAQSYAQKISTLLTYNLSNHDKTIPGFPSLLTSFTR